jgi:Fur family ferric uptake transcriptional regulator
LTAVPVRQTRQKRPMLGLRRAALPASSGLERKGPTAVEGRTMPKAPIERNTRQKRAIRDVFERIRRPLSTDEILAEAQEDIESLGLATVYRSIRSLIDEGFLTPVEVPGRTPLYERAGKQHHHHFMCTECERVYELEGCSSEVRGDLPRGFRATGHDVTIYGKCKDCNKLSASTASKRRS